MTHEGQPVRVEQIQTEVAQEAVQSPAEKEYFKNLSNRLAIKTVANAAIGTAAMVGVGFAAKSLGYDLDIASIIPTGLGAGIGITVVDMIQIREERFPKNK